MPIINCPDCNKEMSDAATDCPNCGRPNADVSTIENSDKKENVGAKVKQKMGPVEAYIGAMKKYGTFKGRATRAEHWYFWLAFFVIGLIIASVSNVIGISLDSVEAMGGIFLLVHLLPCIAVTVRRLHDTGRSGWWYLISLVPFGGLVILIFTLQDSMSGENKYGTNPKSVSIQ